MPHRPGFTALAFQPSFRLSPPSPKEKTAPQGAGSGAESAKTPGSPQLSKLSGVNVITDEECGSSQQRGVLCLFGRCDSLRPFLFVSIVV